MNRSKFFQIMDVLLKHDIEVSSDDIAGLAVALVMGQLDEELIFQGKREEGDLPLSLYSDGEVYRISYRGVCYAGDIPETPDFEKVMRYVDDCFYTGVVNNAPKC